MLIYCFEFKKGESISRNNKVLVLLELEMLSLYTGLGCENYYYKAIWSFGETNQVRPLTYYILFLTLHQGAYCSLSFLKITTAKKRASIVSARSADIARAQ